MAFVDSLREKAQDNFYKVVAERKLPAMNIMIDNAEHAIKYSSMKAANNKQHAISGYVSQGGGGYSDIYDCIDPNLKDSLEPYPYRIDRLWYVPEYKNLLWGTISLNSVVYEEYLQLSKEDIEYILEGIKKRIIALGFKHYTISTETVCAYYSELVHNRWSRYGKWKKLSAGKAVIIKISIRW